MDTWVAGALLSLVAVRADSAQGQNRSPLAWAPILRITTVGVAGFEPTAFRPAVRPGG